ncbi:family 16 glycosylhydrolase [Streptomyces sp. NBC_00708]
MGRRRRRGRQALDAQRSDDADNVLPGASLLPCGFGCPFDYAIEWWNQGTINWFVDGKLVHQENGSRGPLPTRPMRIMANLWPATGVDSWTGPFTYPGAPLTARYDWVKYTKY